MRHLLILVFLCTACGSPFRAEDALIAPPGDGGSDALGAVDAGRDALADSLSPIDAGHDAQGEASAVDASSDVEPLGDSSDGSVVCEPPTPSGYFTVDEHCDEAPADAGNSYFDIPSTFVVNLGASCVGTNTPAACQCEGQYTCACMMPAVLAEDEAQKEHAPDAAPGLLCAGILSDCTVDALGVIHVTCD